eukprot:jgi/Chlat1/5238/Chrsp33S05082
MASSMAIAGRTVARTGVRLAHAAATVAAEAPRLAVDDRAWVFLGPPGVGKGTYASRLAKMLDVPHISAGDLVRAEIYKGTALARQMAATTSAGQLLPDSLVLDLLRRRLDAGYAAGEQGFILDGFPRTYNQAKLLSDVADISRVINLRLREDILVMKCTGRRICSECGGNFNVANIDLPGIKMPPLPAPTGCEGKLLTRADDTEAVVRQRLAVHRRESAPVEAYYRKAGLLMDFDITGGIPETLPRLLEAIQAHSVSDESDDEPAVA